MNGTRVEAGWARRAAHAEISEKDAARMLRPVAGDDRVIRMELLGGGLANTNYKVTLAGRDEPLVLRVYARDPAACAIETALFRLVHQRVRVAELLYADAQGAETGHVYAVLSWVDGVLLADLLAAGDAGAAAEAGYAAGETLAAIGSFTFDRAGVLDAGLAVRPEPFNDGPALVTGIERYLSERGAGKRLGRPLTASLRRHVQEHAGCLAAISGMASLVHGDYKPTNLLMRQERGRWRVAAALDWEFAFAGPWLFDLGQMVRYSASFPPTFAPAVIDGLRAGGAAVPLDWRRIVRLMDLVNLLDFAARAEGEGPMLADVRRLVAATVGEC
jgi:aminoglycoside phosphotransferase (APT) family kinase protein